MAHMLTVLGRLSNWCRRILQHKMNQCNAHDHAFAAGTVLRHPELHEGSVQTSVQAVTLRFPGCDRSAHFALELFVLCLVLAPAFPDFSRADCVSASFFSRSLILSAPHALATSTSFLSWLRPVIRSSRSFCAS